LVWGLVLALTASAVCADEGGVSFWTPGQFGSLAALPGAPGWSVATIWYHPAADAGVSSNFPRGGNIVAGLDARADVLFVAPTYTFAQPVLGAQAAFGLMGGVGHTKVSTSATLTGPGGTVISLGESDSLSSNTDLYALGTLKWARGAHNYMAYTLLGAPVGSYRAGRLANLGTNHWSIDAGGGYTYFDTQKGREFSAVAGLTYNFENDDTDYRNGVDGHIDWAASQFFSERLHAGLVGYFYHQLTGDSGAGTALLGDFKSRTHGIGPQLGYFFPVAAGKGYFNLRGYWEFDARHRPEGWNLWLTLALPLGNTSK
jgi:hypothetical protein